MTNFAPIKKYKDLLRSTKYEKFYESLGAPHSNLKTLLGDNNYNKLADDLELTTMVVYESGNAIHHNIQTPIALVKEITDRISIANTVDIDCLVFYTIEWANYLNKVVGIPANRIWVVCEHDSQERQDACAYAGFNVIWSRIIQKNFILTKGKPMSKKFGLVVGNPPYSIPGMTGQGGDNNLWKQISKIAIDLVDSNGYIGFVTPGIPYSNKTELGPKFRDLQTQVVWTDVHHYFKSEGSNPGTEIAAWVIQNKPNYQLTYVADQNRHIDLTTRPYNRILLPIEDAILDKISTLQKSIGYHDIRQDKLSKDNIVDVQSNSHPYPVRWGSPTNNKFKYSNLKTFCYDKNRVMYSCSGNPNWEYFDSSTGASSVSAQSGYLLVSNAIEGQRFIDQTSLKLNQFKKLKTKSTGAFSSSVEDYYFPKFDLTVDITDEDAYKAANLTPDEIAYIESTFK